MGVLYSVIPLEPDMQEWLTKQSVLYPPMGHGRRPTPRELRSAAQALPNVACEFYGGEGDAFTQIDIHSGASDDGPWTLLNLRGRTGLDDFCDINFEKGWPELIVEFLLHVCRSTGPLVLFPDTGESPAVIWAQRAAQEILSEWEHTTPSSAVE